ncbi:MAG: hypothetical protein DSY90_14580 [Deltaproteobacteria bacterium]|nr:MAG: hypothetical protein DSY90_14580 [Deltaproteobacteria bacterium]
MAGGRFDNRVSGRCEDGLLSGFSFLKDPCHHSNITGCQPLLRGDFDTEPACQIHYGFWWFYFFKAWAGEKPLYFLRSVPWSVWERFT